jgi:hypothetical protein
VVAVDVDPAEMPGLAIRVEQVRGPERAAPAVPEEEEELGRVEILDHVDDGFRVVHVLLDRERLGRRVSRRR